MYPEGCALYTENLFAIVENAITLEEIAVQQVDTRISYGIVALPDLPRGTYNVKVKMGEHSKKATDFTVSLYSKVEQL